MLIGLLGFQSAGKGTAGDVLASDYAFQKQEFADPLKDAVSIIFNWPRHLLSGDTEESRIFREKVDDDWSLRLGYVVTPRNMLQKMGTEAGRNVFGDDLWVQSLDSRIDMTKNNVITDVRFPNEIKWIRSKGGFVIRVTRGPDPSWYDTAWEYNKSDRSEWVLYDENDKAVHYSEWAWIGQTIDYLIHNTSSIQELKNNISHMIQIFTGPPSNE